MLFDKFCGVVERRLLCKRVPSIRDLTAQAKLFVLEGDDRSILPRCTELLRGNEEDFFLPFDTIAIEDSVSCFMVWNTVPGARGLDIPRETLEIRPVLDVETPDLVRTLGKGSESRLRDSLWITLGTLTRIWVEDENVHHHFSLGDIFVVSKHEGILLSIDPRMRGEGMTSACSSAAANAMTAIQQVAWINNPEYFILERSVLGDHARPVKGGRIPRSDDRPTYRLLHRSRVRSTLGIEDSSECNRQIAPHPRRAHRRTFRNPRFEHSGILGTQIVVRSTWVGASERIMGRYRYKVLLDV